MLACSSREKARTPHIETQCNPTSPLTTPTSGGTLVNATVMVPNNPILRLENAAARGSVVSSSAVATADELAPSVTPRVM